MIERNIGIVSDGPTDFEIIGKFVTSLLEEKNVRLKLIPLKRQSLRDPIDRYWKDANRNNEYNFPDDPASRLQKSAVQIITQAFYEFLRETDKLSNHDIMLMVSDAERSLKHPEDYLRPWAFCISKVITGAIDIFYYHLSEQGYSDKYLPMVLSLIIFPSTEVIVAAAKNLLPEHFGKKPNQLKKLLYGTDNLRTLKSDELQEKALNLN